MPKLLVLAGLFIEFLPCWAQGPLNDGSEQTKCDSHKMVVNLRDKNPNVLREVEDRWIRAYGERDAELLRCILADDFEIASMPDEKLEINNKQHVMEWIASKSRSANRVEQLDIRTHDQAAVVRGLYSVRTQEGKLTSRFQFTDVFLYRANGWQAVSREIAQLPVR